MGLFERGKVKKRKNWDEKKLLEILRKVRITVIAEIMVDVILRPLRALNANIDQKHLFGSIESTRQLLNRFAAIPHTRIISRTTLVKIFKAFVLHSFF